MSYGAAMMLRLLRTWSAKAHLFKFVYLGNSKAFYARTLKFPECALDDNNIASHFEPYQGLAEFWQGYADSNHLNYGGFVAGVAKARQIEFFSALDLACGTGTQTAYLANFIPEVVGLDASEPMLEQARRCCPGRPGVRFVRGDFRDFRLGQAFDAIVCGFNSLNYVADIDELRRVFQSVARHLTPDGIFVFDTITRSGMLQLSGLFYHVEADGKRFAIHFEYAERESIEKATVLMPTGIETHVRIPIDPQDVKKGF